MTNIVMIARDRPRLTEQTLTSLWENTDRNSFNLTIVDDGSKLHINEMAGTNSAIVVTLSHPVGIVGFARNLGVEVAQKYFGRGDQLYFSDNDVYFKPGWLEKMTYVLRYGQEDTPRCVILGGVRHPFHQPNITHVHVREPELNWDEVDAVAGYSMLMRWGTWDTYGPFDAHAEGVGQSEDYALCQRAIRAGGKVGYIHPSVLVNCGLTNTMGEKVPGWDQIERVEGVVQE